MFTLVNIPDIIIYAADNNKRKSSQVINLLGYFAVRGGRQTHTYICIYNRVYANKPSRLVRILSGVRQIDMFNCMYSSLFKANILFFSIWMSVNSIFGIFG